MKAGLYEFAAWACALLAFLLSCTVIAPLLLIPLTFYFLRRKDSLKAAEAAREQEVVMIPDESLEKLRKDLFG